MTLRSLAVVKSRHGVSIAAALRRCSDLRLIDSDRQLSLQKQISARGWRKNEPVYVPPEEPLLIKRLAEVALGGAQPIRMAHAVGIPALAARDLLG